MSWEIFKRNILRYSNNPDSIKDIDQVANFYAREYDLAIKRGYDTMNLVTLQQGNVPAMEKLFKLALQAGYKSASPYDIVGKMGKGVLAYWTGGVMNPLPIPLIPSPGSVANVAVITNSVTNPGTWLSEPSTPALIAKLPDDNNTFEGARKVVLETGPEILNDDPPDNYIETGGAGGDGISSQISSLISEFGGSNPGANVLTNPITSDTALFGDTPTYAGESKQTSCIDSFNYDMNLSPNVRLRDLSIGATFSHKIKGQAGFDANGIVCNLKHLAVNIVEPLKKQYPGLVINSGFRGTPSINGRVSQHEKGEAVDIQIPYMKPQQYLSVANWIRVNLPFDQMIFEHGNNIWLHISCARTKTTQRKQLLTMINGRYEPGLKCYYS